MPRRKSFRNLIGERPASGASARRSGRQVFSARRGLCVEWLEYRILLTASASSLRSVAPPLFAADLSAQQASLDLRVSWLGGSNQVVPSAGTTISPPFGPSDISQAYGFNNIYFPGSGGSSITGDGTGQTIAIVVAYHQPNLIADLHAFNLRYGLPDPQVTVCNQNGSTSAANYPANATGNWGIEAALDVQWAHALAPRANILVVEAANSGLNNLYTAVNTAAKAGTGSLSTLPFTTIVSMSWGAAEYSGESNNTYFNTPAGKSGVVFVAATGDTGGAVQYPAADPRVVAVGGTALSINASGTYATESAWNGSNGGFSAINSVPSYQVGITPYGAQNTNSMRMAPDVSFVGSNGTSLWVYDSYDFPSSPWVGVSGTSAGTPCWAALFAIADQGRVNGGGTPLTGSQALSTLYTQYTNGTYSYKFHDVIGGNNSSYTAGAGYDLATGLGSPRANVIAAMFAGVSQTPTPIAPSGTVTTITPTFQWSAVAGASGYYLTIVDNTTHVTVANKLVVNGTSYIPTTPLANNDAFQWQVQAFDATGALGPASSQLTFTVNAVINHAPTGTSGAVTTREDVPYTLGVSNFGFSDSSDSPANNLLAVKITTLPANGLLTDNGAAVTTGQFVSVSDISSGLLKFTPASNANGAAYASFTFQVQDDGGTANGGANLDPTPKTLTVNVTAVNDAPTGTNFTANTYEDFPYVFAASDFGFADSNDSPPNNLLAVKISTLPATGTLLDNGVAVTVGQFISSADITGGLLSFVPAPHTYGTPYTSFTFQVQDDGGTANGGVDLDLTPRLASINVTSMVTIAGPSSALRGETETYTLTAYGTPDQLAAGFVFTINWGDGSPVQSVTGLSGMQVTHGYDPTGDFTISVTATDNSSATSAVVTTGVHVDAFQLRANAQNTALIDLAWGGTSGADRVEFIQLSPTSIRVHESMINGVAVDNTQDFSGITGRVIGSAAGGNDQLDSRGLTTVPSTLDGGGGNNTLYGGSAGDILIGGSNGAEGKQGSNVIIAGNGDNTIYGNGLTARRGATGGNNLIMGGTGHDVIYGSFGANPTGNGGEGGQNLIVGGGGGDTIYASQITDGAEGGHGSILIAGTTTLNQAALQSILTEWTSSHALADKIANISGTGTGTRFNGNAYLQPDVTVQDDNVPDTIWSDTYGSANWLLLSLNNQDTANREKAIDIETDLP